MKPLTVQVYPGADGRFMLYEDDGQTFCDYQTREHGWGSRCAGPTRGGR